MTPSYAGVYLLDAPFAIDRVYDYLIPRSLCDVVHRGSFVTVPFGNGNRKHLALVASVKEESPFPKHIPTLSLLRSVFWSTRPRLCRTRRLNLP